MTRIHLIVNPSAGGGRAARLLPAAEHALASRGLEVGTTITTGLAHAGAAARSAAGEGAAAVTLGGDGLVGAVAGALRGVPGAVMGVMPGGRGNDFARGSGIPLDDLDGAAAVVAAGRTRPLDVGEVDGATFIGIASLGLDSEANRIANAAPSRLGNLVYAYGALRAVMSWTPATFSVAVDGVPHDFTGWSVVAANAKAYGGGMHVAPDAELDDGLLDVVLTARSGKVHFLRTLPKVFKGHHVDDPKVTVLRGREVRVDADRPFDVYADGDPIGTLPATVRVVPGAVDVLLP